MGKGRMLSGQQIMATQRGLNPSYQLSSLAQARFLRVQRSWALLLSSTTRKEVSRPQEEDGFLGLLGTQDQRKTCLRFHKGHKHGKEAAEECQT